MDDTSLMLPERSAPPAADFSAHRDNASPPTDRKLRAILREWRTMAACFLVIVAFGVVYLVVAPRRYTASAIVMAAPRQPDLSRTDSVLNGTTTPEPMIVRDPDIEGEIEIMSAPSALQRVVTDLELSSPSNQEISDRPSIHDLLQTVRVLLGLEKADPAHPVSMQSLGRQVLGKLGFGDPAEAAATASSVRRAELATDLLIRNLKVAPIGKSTMVKIDYTAGNPELAARVASAVAENYIRARSQNRLDAASQASEWLRSHTADLRAQLLEAETKLAAFRASTQINGRDALQLEGDMKVLGDRIIVAKADQAKVSMRLAVAEERNRRDGPIGLLNWEDAHAADEYLTQARAVAEMHKEAAKMAVTAGSFNPNVIRLEAEAKTLEGKLNSQAQTKLGNLRMTADAASREVASLETAMQKMRANYDQLEAAGVQLSALQQATLAARTVYQNFVTRWRTTEQNGFNEAAGWLVSPAGVPVRPTWPSIPLVLIGSVVAGLGVGVSGALWKEHRGSRTLRSSEDVERLLPGSCGLGLLPELASSCRSARDVVAATGTGSDPEFEEAVGNVWTSIVQAIDLRSSPARGRIVLISSALPQEGKSASAGVIACAAAAAGQRVVVVDCDLRLPMMSKALSVAASPGLVDCIEGGVDYHPALTVNAVKQVSVLPAGRTRKEPQQVLRSQHFATLLFKLSHEFDLVLVDSPPVLGLSDARLLAKLADHTILVAVWSRTTWKAVTLALNILARSGGNIAGVILTRANMGRVAKFGFAEAEPFHGRYRSYYHGHQDWHGEVSHKQSRIKGSTA